MTENQSRDEICRIGKSLFDRGYVHGTAGNISVRLAASDGGGFLMTPTDACLGFLDPSKLARLDASAKQLSGDRASKSIALHAGIYAAATRLDAQTCCVIHTHSTHCVALSLQAGSAELLPPVTPYFVMKVGRVPRIAYHHPGDPRAAQQVAQTIADYGRRGAPIRAVMLERLGPHVWHQTPAATMATLEELEETAKLWLLANPKPESLTELQIDELRQRFGAHW